MFERDKDDLHSWNKTFMSVFASAHAEVRPNIRFLENYPDLASGATSPSELCTFHLAATMWRNQILPPTEVGEKGSQGKT
jgi:hypothetical protein